MVASSGTTKRVISKRFAYGLVILYGTGIIMFIISIVWANRAAQQAVEDTKRSVCIIANNINEGQDAQPPQAESGIEFAKQIDESRASLGC